LQIGNMRGRTVTTGLVAQGKKLRDFHGLEESAPNELTFGALDRGRTLGLGVRGSKRNEGTAMMIITSTDEPLPGQRRASAKLG